MDYVFNSQQPPVPRRGWLARALALLRLGVLPKPRSGLHIYLETRQGDDVFRYRGEAEQGEDVEAFRKTMEKRGQRVLALDRRIGLRIRGDYSVIEE